jgi:LacI family transcriptional regulator
VKAENEMMNQNAKTTILDIAREAGVSKSTVSMVMNSSPQISLKTYEKVWAVIQKLHYEPNIEARKLAHRRWSTPGVNSPGFAQAEQPLPLV